MPVTALTVYKNCTYQSVNLVGVHNPVVFMVTVDYTGVAPERINIEILDDTDTVIGDISCAPYADVQAGQRYYFAVADQYLRSFINDLTDFEQPVQTIDHVDNMTKYLKCRFYYTNADLSAVYSSYFYIIIGNMSAQIGEREAQTDIYNNSSELIIGYEDKPVYVYFYNNSTTNTIALPA